jgi:ABC-type transport system involved in cytochrome c biogenesis ATPase subunit
MVSTTTNKKEIVDFLWDWAGNADWAKLLVQKIVSTENSLLPVERDEVFKYFLQSIGLETGLPSLSISKPTYTPQSKQLELVSLSEVTGVNKLAKNQVIDFSANITVIYGENGTGKTGYGRILKALGFSYDRGNKIYSNIFGHSEPQTAKIKYKTNDGEDTFNWDGSNRIDDLESVSVFNNNCVQISLDGSRQLIVSPIGFHLFNLVSSELGELDILYRAKKREYPIEINWIESLHDGTPQHQFISSLSKDSSKEKLNELSNFGEEQEKELKEKETQLSKLSKDLLQNEIRALRSQIGELKAIIDKIDQNKKVLNAETWKKLIDTNKTITELEKNTQKGISEIAASKGIEFYETDEFKSFLSAAETYIKKINKETYPQENDVCVYCRQPLEKDAQELLKNYRKLLNDKTEENIAQLKKSKQSLINQVRDIDTSLKLNFASFGLDEEEKPVQPSEFVSFNKEASTFKSTFIKDEVAEGSVFDLKYDVFHKFVSDKKELLEKHLISRTESFENIEAKEKELKKKIAELKDRKLLSGKQPEVNKVIANHKKIAILNSHSNSFSTNSISRKTSQAREELVSQDFNDIFKKELKALRKSGLPIDLSFGTDRGTTKLSHRISNHQLLEILSEGEQKAIALAEFLTELQLDNIKAPVIFDDPVNSLDHKIIDAVGKRLIRLSKDRQVIIFTHSILLLNSLIQQSELPIYKQDGINFSFIKVKSNFGLTGVVDEVEEINSFDYYRKKLNKVLETKPEGEEAKLAAEGYGHLRSAIEVSVESDVLQKSIRRYSKGVAFPSFLRVRGKEIDEYKGALNDIYEKCCTSIDGHSSPEEVPSTPCIDDLRADYESFKEIRKVFTKPL